MRWLWAALMSGLPMVLLAQVAEPEGYRTQQYRAAVPSELSGGTVITTPEAEALWREGQAAFVDVLPQAPKPANLPEGTIWRDKPRHSIPGAIWLPNTGYGALAEVTLDYFLTGLKAASGGDKAHPLVFFCLEECWMSYNAARRALELGYKDVSWYPDGTDGWTFFDLPAEQIKPFPEE